MLLWITVLFLAPVAGTSADPPKAVVRLEPPWIQVLRGDRVTLTCEGAPSPGNHSTQWLHNGRLIPTQVLPSYRFTAKGNDSGEYRCQVLPSYRFTAKGNDSGEYRCQAGGTSLSDPVRLDVISDWLVLQTSQLIFQEGDVIVLRCHSWNNWPLAKVTFYHNGVAKKYFSISKNFSIPQANHSHSGAYNCTGLIGRTSHTSPPVTITVQGPKSSDSSMVVIIVAAVIGIATAAIVVAVVAIICLKKKQPPANLSDPEEVAKSEVENTITYSLLKHPEAQDDDTEHDYQNHI
nr:Fc-gamma-1/gamma-2 receptor precursor [Cavia sp.]